MNLQTFVTQIWRLGRVGGTAALAATQASTHVASGDHKALVLAGAVAGVEVLYRALVPVADQAKFYKLYLSFKSFLASQQGTTPLSLAERAAQGIVEADKNSAEAAKVQ